MLALPRDVLSDIIQGRPIQLELYIPVDNQFQFELNDFGKFVHCFASSIHSGSRITFQLSGVFLLIPAQMIKGGSLRGKSS